jgi:CDP-glucose 4,6-dehydratase
MASDFWNGKRVFVSGAEGFIGNWLCNRLVEEKAIVFESDFSEKNPFSSKRNTEKIKIDILDKKSVESALKNSWPEVFFHLASQSIVREGKTAEFFRTNVEGTLNVLEACRLNNVSNIIVASSIKVYDGTNAEILIEDQPILGVEDYDVSKACCDIISRSFALKHGMKINAARCANTFGGADWHFSRIIPKAAWLALNGKEIPLFGDSGLKRDFLHVSDAVNAYLLLAENAERKNIQGEAFNFASGKSHSLKEIAEKIILISESSSSKIKLIPKTERNEKSSIVSISKAKKVLNWRPKASLEEGLKETIQWYKNNFNIAEKSGLVPK